MRRLGTLLVRFGLEVKELFGAIIIGLVVGSIYTFFIKRKIVIKMPEQVPQAIAKQFEAMIPAFVIFLLSMIVYILASSLTNGGTFIEMIYSAIQVPLQGLTGSLYGAIGIAFFYIIFVVVWCSWTIGSKWSSDSSAFI